ncbi:MAG TPA: aromatic ring-hydroxylating dioxygenase subunit alpha [Gaiellaceae bacterium]|nr:aromatic ring-hydroxylating dioxygenase subunit alpha [Gaiellaceae bacterium]
MEARTLATLPWSWYSDPAVLSLERERIFRRSWQYVGHTGELAEPGAFRATSAAGVPVVLVRDEDGELRAFLNVCRHRGSLIVEGAGVRAALQCPYHAWTYGLDGRLLRAPRLEREGLARDELSLVELRLERWGPFLFVNPDREAPPLAAHLDRVPELLAAAGIEVEALRFATRVESEIAANWKICAENFLECYHCPVAHHGFSAVVDVSPDAYLLEADGGRLSQVGPPRPEPRGSFDPHGEVERGQFHLLFPGTVLNVMPGRPNLSIGPIVPLSPARTYRLLDYFVAPDVEDAWLEELLAFDAQVGEEDVELVERVQAGVGSGLLDEGRLLPASETLVARFQELVVDALA